MGANPWDRPVIIPPHPGTLLKINRICEAEDYESQFNEQYNKVIPALIKKICASAK
jgi:hypothetical protein